MMNEHRRSFMDRDLLYLFSYDVNLEAEREEIGLVSGGARFNIFSTAKNSRVYHVLHERVRMDVKPLSGVVVWGADFAYLREDSDICVIDAQVTIETDDGALIHSAYGGVLPAGPNGARRLLADAPRLGTASNPFMTSFVTTPRYETTSPTYDWLTRYQCVGFGQAAVVNSQVKQVTFDIYAMD